MIKYPGYTKLFLLAAGVFLASGMAYLSWLKVTAIGTVLFMNYEFAHDTAGFIEQINAVLLIAAVLFLFLRQTRIYAAGFILMFTCIFVWAEYDQGGYPYSDYAFLANAMRLATPVAMLIFFSRYLENHYPQYSFSFFKWLIIAGTSITFIMHGFEAIWAHPWFIDMTLGMGYKLIGWRMSQTMAEQLLVAVGIVDIVSAIILIVFRSRTAALWMAFWGFFTCFVRLVNYGMGAFPDVLIRMPHGILPIILYTIFQQERKFIIPNEVVDSPANNSVIRGVQGAT